ncbi:hypothetical protein BDZ45DRAFT_725399 [Acephala macrosclerotiorum]|nr:hypothetical protein BDZ45DRAFT_725399 [Acephala macrosclerotiorum]
MNHQFPGEDLTDLDEDFDSCDEDEYIQSEDLCQISDRFSVYHQDRNTLIRPTLQDAKEALIDRLTRQFWTNFHKNQYRRYPLDVMNGGAHASYAHLYVLESASDFESYHVQSDSFDNGDFRAPKRPRTAHSLHEPADSDAKFACPYRKHDPRKYCVPNWGPCALTPLQTVARLKAHLYRYHRIHQCPRCKGIFDSEEDLDAHVEATEGCEAKPDRQVEGVTGRMMERLRSRKKTYPGQTEADRWREVYQLLFPSEEVPSPYFEHIRDHDDNDIRQSKTQEVEKYEDYLRQELPKFFKRALDSAISEEIQPIEERLGRKMMEILEEAQKLAFSTYRSMIDSAAGSPPPNFLQEETYLLVANPSLTNPKDPPSASSEVQQPSTPPFLSDYSPNSGSRVCFPDLDIHQHELQHVSLLTSKGHSRPSQRRAPLKTSDTATESNSNSPSPSRLTSVVENSRRLPQPELLGKDSELLESNTGPVFGDVGDRLAFFSEEWALSSEELDLADFNWTPSWDITTAAKGA